ncbi:MAG: 4-phosphoerythronate dehydrogenase [Pseudomonadota bacterium]
MNLLLDPQLSNATELFSEFGECTWIDPLHITYQIKSADILIVRSTTQVNQKLLKNSPVKCVGTATSGTDHIDLHYLQRNNIYFAEAKGCNAAAVADYVVLNVLAARHEQEKTLVDASVSIIGCGSVGRIVVRRLLALGCHVQVCDPPLQANLKISLTDYLNIRNKNVRWVSWNEALNTDMLCLHTPLIQQGDYPTHHLLNMNSLKKLPDYCIVLNAGRGSVIDMQAWEKIQPQKKLLGIFDVWENEPFISASSLQSVWRASPHIAGHTKRGKLMGSIMIRDALRVFLKIKTIDQFTNVSFIKSQFGSSHDFLKLEDEISLDTEKKLFNALENIESFKTLDDNFRSFLLPEKEKTAQISAFKEVRKNYILREEIRDWAENMSANISENHPYYNFILTILSD